MGVYQFTLHTISDGGTLLHYHDYRTRSWRNYATRERAYIPICRTKARNYDWQIDGGVGTLGMCKRCVRIHEERLKAKRAREAANKRKAYRQNPTFFNERNAAYRAECREAINLKQRLRHYRDREEILRRKREKRLKMQKLRRLARSRSGNSSKTSTPEATNVGLHSRAA